MSASRFIAIAALVSAAILLTACDTSNTVLAGEGDGQQSVQSEPNTQPLVDFDSAKKLSESQFEERYPWPWKHATPGGRSTYPGASPLDEVVSTPDGFSRVELKDGSFGDFLRTVPLRRDRHHVLAHDGRHLDSPAVGVFLIPMTDAGVQECADSLIRLRAEFLRSRGRSEDIAFHFTSGDVSTWPAWLEGERFRIEGATVHRIDGEGRSANRSTFRNYLTHLFRYAGTRSLHHDAEKLGADQSTRPGDFFLDPGSPGHAVLVLDVATNADGDRFALLGQGFMPAQEFHLLDASQTTNRGDVWFRLPDEPGETLNTPSWEPFGFTQRWRFP